MSVPAQRALRSAIESRRFDPAYYLHGDDEHRKDEAVAQLVAAVVDPAMRDFNFEVVRGSDADPERLGVSLNSLPMLAERRLVLLRDAGALKKAARAELDRYLAAPALETILVMTTPAGGKTDEAIAGRATTIEFSPLTGDQLRQWLVAQAKRMGSELSDESADLLATAIDGDLTHGIGELDKLASFANGRTITAADIEAIVGVRRGETTVDLLDAIATQDGARAAALVPHVLAQPKVTAVQVIMMITTQMVGIAWGRASRDAGMSASRLESEFISLIRNNRGYVGRPYGEAAKCWARNLSKWSASSLVRALRQLRSADMSLKDTKVSSDEAILATLVLALCAPGARRAA